MSIFAETINFLLSTGNSGNIGNEPGKTEEKAQKAVPILGKRTGNNGNNPQKIQVSENFNSDGAGLSDTLVTAYEGVTNPKVSTGLHPYHYRLKNDKGGGTYLTPAATHEEARAELLRRWPDELLMVTRGG